MLASHMESKGQRWPNVGLGEIGDVSAAFNYGFSDMMMNNLWVYDFNILEDSQNHLGSSAFTVSDPALSSSRFFIDTQHNIENDNPNSMKTAEVKESKVTQKCVKKPRSKRCKRTVFEGLVGFTFTSTQSTDLYGSVDYQGSVMSKRTYKNNQRKRCSKNNESKRSSKNDVSPTLKRQKIQKLENHDSISESVSVNSVGRWLEDVGFGRYAGVFEMHEVDDEALPLLTHDDLKEMGVLAVGTRRKLYAAICRLRGESDE